jgi:hypothetical protein
MVDSSSTIGMPRMPDIANAHQKAGGGLKAMII